MGLYRFWYRTRLRRYYWGNTRLLSDGLDYTGTGKELMIGFLIFVAIFIPINLVATAVGLVAGANAEEVVALVVSAIVIPAVLLMALYRARRYQLSRTRFLGIRFAQSGTARGFLWTTFLWLLATIFTFGIMFPYLRAAMQRYRMQHTSFGSLQGSFDAKAGPLMKRWLLIWAVVPVLAALGITAGIVNAMPGNSKLGVVLGAVFLLLFLSIPILWFYYRALEFRHFTGHTRLGGLSFTSDVSGRSLFWANVKFYLILSAIFLALGVAGFVVLGGGAMALFAKAPVVLLERPEVIAGLVGLAIFGMLAVLLIFGLVKELYLTRRLWVLYVSSVTVYGLDALVHVLQMEGAEGGAFADAYDGGYDLAG